MDRTFNMEYNFEDIRPYKDSEIPSAISRLINNILFPVIIQTLYPDRDVDKFREEISTINSVQEFQSKFMYPLINRIAEMSVNNLTYNGVVELDPNQKSIFISNHRDITLDSAFLDIKLHAHGLDTCEITFGSNLMKGELVIDLGKMNKMFRIIRGGNIRDFYKNSIEVSSYMRYAITQKKQSIWIAQRNGRTKNGDDKTEMAVLKMLSLSSDKPFVENLSSLNITPIAISYEYEPCDFLKAAELYVSTYQKYEKGINEDLNSILTGIQQYKGDVHFTITKSITREELEYCDSFEKNEKFSRLAGIIDKRIFQNYKLFKTNYIANDLLNKSYRYQEFYTATQKEEFIKYMNNGLDKLVGERSELETLFLKIYATPVDNIRSTHLITLS